MKVGSAEAIGPILMGMSKPVYVLPRGAEVGDIVNITAIAVVEAQSKSSPGPSIETARIGCDRGLTRPYKYGFSPTAHEGSCCSILSRAPLKFEQK